MRNALRASAAPAAALGGATILSLQPTMDLTKVIARVAKEHPDWSQGRLDNAERDYRQFWLSCKSSHDHQRPTKDADEVWHAHLLHTREYARDSESYFGYFLHHVPDEIGNDNLADCQGGGDGCTACGSGCSGGGTIKAVCADGGDEPVI